LPKGRNLSFKEIPPNTGQTFLFTAIYNPYIIYVTSLVLSHDEGKMDSNLISTKSLNVSHLSNEIGSSFQRLCKGYQSLRPTNCILLLWADSE
jgi:hypothetical protein